MDIIKSKKFLLSLIFIFSLIFANDSKYIFIYDEYNNPIDNANISLINKESNQVDTFGKTDNDGKYQLDIKDVENYLLEISHIGYESFIQNLSSNIDDMYIILKKNTFNSDDIIVTATRYDRHIKDSPVLIHVISNSDIKNGSFSTVKEMMEVALPNVQMVASNHGNDRIKIQGLDNKYSLFLVDGERISGEYAGNIDFSLFNLSNVEKMEIVEGGMSVLYGSGAIGSIVNIITKKRTEPYWFDFSYYNDNPLFISKSLNLGFNKNNFFYDINFINKGSDGYDLTPQSEFSKTLEQNNINSWNHTLSYKFKDNYSIKFYQEFYQSKTTQYNQIFSMDTFDYITILDSPLSRYNGNTYKIKFEGNLNKESYLKIVFHRESYIKKYYYPGYYNNNYIDDGIENGDEFRHGDLEHSEFQIQYNYKTDFHTRLLGFEYIDDAYSAYNIYPLDDENPPLHESIFSGENKTYKRIQCALFLHDQFIISDQNEFALGLRYINNGKLIGSASYLFKHISGYNIRATLSSGYREPSLKELYYQWVDHTPHIYGNPNLESTTNNNFSVSFDKRTLLNNFSIDFYNNDIKNMISTEYTEEGLVYKNYNSVTINGINIHYSREINNNSNIRFVYNYTNPKSNSDEILEGISNHTFRLNYSRILNDYLDVAVIIRYTGEKNNFDQEEDWIGGNSIKILDACWLSDVIFYSKLNSAVNIKFGIKNLFDYKDPSRFDENESDILNTYDPGRRFYFEFQLKLN